MPISKWDENYPVCIKDGSPAKDEHSNLCEYHSQFVKPQSSTQLTSNKHSICLPCAREIYPEIVNQVERYQNHERDKTTEFCCYCGWLHASGIYLETEESNSDMTCNNNHRAAPQDREELDSCVIHRTTRKNVIEILVGLAILAIGTIIAILWMASTK